jgi:hypothetical protein
MDYKTLLRPWNSRCPRGWGPQPQAFGLRGRTGIVQGRDRWRSLPRKEPRARGGTGVDDGNYSVTTENGVFMDASKAELKRYQNKPEDSEFVLSAEQRRDTSE